MANAKMRAPVLSVQHGAKPLSQRLRAALQGVVVTRQVNVPTMFSLALSLSDMGDSDGASVKNAFTLADEVMIKLGLSRPTSLVKGKVMSIETSYGERSIVSVHGFDAMDDLRFGRRFRQRAFTTWEGLFAEVADEAKLTPAFEDSLPELDPAPEPILQRYETNYEFLRRLCGWFNFEMLIDADTGYLTFRRSAEGGEPSTTLLYRKHIEAMQVSESARTEGQRVTVRSYDDASNQIIEAQDDYADARDPMGTESGYLPADEGVPSSSVVVARPDIRGQGQLMAMAKAMTAIGTSGFVTATATLIGDPEGAVAGETVEIQGIDSRLNGPYYIVKSLHSYDQADGYRCQIELRRSSL